MAAIDNFWLDIFVNYTLLGAVFRLVPASRSISRALNVAPVFHAPATLPPPTHPPSHNRPLCPPAARCG